MNTLSIAARIGREAGTHEKVLLLADGHVHVHPAHDERLLIETAISNLSRMGSGLPVVFLTETSRASVFEKWAAGQAPFPVRSTGESDSLVMDDRLLVVAGRQVVTREKIEVLALGTVARFHEGISLDETLDEVEASGAVAVLPWGLGKWLGVRGGLVTSVVSRRQVLLGDNAGRPFFWPSPGVFRQRPVVPGTDPLNASGEERHVGTYGFRLECDLDFDRPVNSIRETLRSLKAGSPGFSGRRIPFPFSITRQLKHFLPGGKSSAVSGSANKKPLPTTLS